MKVDQQYILLAISLVLMPVSMLGLGFTLKRISDKSPNFIDWEGITDAASFAITRSLVGQDGGVLDIDRFKREYLAFRLNQRREWISRVGSVVIIASLFSTLVAVLSFIGIIE